MFNYSIDGRKSVSMTLRFRLRSGQTTGDKLRQLYIRMRVNGQSCSDYASGVYVAPDKWNAGAQKATGLSRLSKEINDELENIVVEHKALLAELARLYQAKTLASRPSAELVKQHWTKKTSIVPLLLEAYDTYVDYLRTLSGTPEERNPRTLEKWDLGRLYLSQYVELAKADRISVDLVTPLWAEGWYHALIKRPLGKATAARFVGYLRASINHLVASHVIERNPLANYFPDKGKDKPVYFLDQSHIDKLWSLDITAPIHGLVRDWLLLMCYTGMDQPDLERYVRNPGRYTVETPDGVMIQISRGKTDITACIPLLPEVGRLLARYPDEVPFISNQTINLWTSLIEKQIGFEHRLTTKICRKTAGAMFLGFGFRLEEVSRVLGHSSIQTTIRHYVRATGSMVQAGMRRVQSCGSIHFEGRKEVSHA